MERASIKSARLITFILFFIYIVLTWFNFLSPIHFVKPNFVLVFISVLGFFASDFLIFSIYSLLSIFIVKYSSFFNWEYFILCVIAFLSFFISKNFLYKKNHLTIGLIITLFQLLFYLLVGQVSLIFSLIFIMELVFNILLGELLFFLGLWLKKIFY